MQKRDMGPEYGGLSEIAQEAVDIVIERVEQGAPVAKLAFAVAEKPNWPHDSEAYAYPHPGGGIAWGLNGPPHGFCIARGIVGRPVPAAALPQPASGATVAPVEGSCPFCGHANEAAVPDGHGLIECTACPNKYTAPTRI